MIAIVLGTRPEVIKLSPLIRELEKRHTPFQLIHSNQHYSYEMDKAIFEDLEIREPDYNLQISGRSHQAQMVAEMMIKLEEIFLKTHPDCVVVQGDTNTVLAAALVASKLTIPVAHVEAGLRSYDRTMPEEVNRVVTDHVSSYLFCPTDVQKNILAGEGLVQGVMSVGNTVVDAVLQNVEKARKQENFDEYGEYLLLTLHRPSNVDDSERLSQIISLVTVKAQEKNIRVIFPIHPRTLAVLKKSGIELGECFVQLEPQSYLKMLALESQARCIATDSGGIQEEACILNVPCLTLRTSTERPETIEVGANVLASNLEKFSESFETAWNLPINWVQPFGDGNSAARIVDVLLDKREKAR